MGSELSQAKDSRVYDVHVGRSWSGHRLEDDCPCPKQPCGLVALNEADPDCPQHGWGAAKTMRQIHDAADCARVLAEGQAR